MPPALLARYSDVPKLKRMLAEREMAIDTLKEINRRKW
jgi:hypothetical protein